MKKLLTTLSFFGLAAASYGVTVFSENFDSWAVEPSGQATTPASGLGYVWGAEGYSATNDYIWGYYPGADPETNRYSVSGPGGAFSDAVSGNAFVASLDYDASDMWANPTVTYRNFVEYTVIGSLTAEQVAAGTISLTASVKSLADFTEGGVLKQFGIHNSASANTEGGVYFKIGNGSDVYATQTISVGAGSSASEWTTDTLSFALTSGNIGNWIKIGYYAESENYSAATVAIDNVSVSVVPEPSTYALLAGFAAFLFVAIRRRK